MGRARDCCFCRGLRGLLHSRAIAPSGQIMHVGSYASGTAASYVGVASQASIKKAV